MGFLSYLSQNEWSNFRLENMMLRYSSFVPRLYNFCISLGFEPGKIMPSRAFCSDENQGFPIILITKHFGTFPFNHGRVGGIVATDRHGPYAEHGKDLVIIQASHVGYDPDTRQFGEYRRMQTDANENTRSCGKIASVIDWYEKGYRFAQANIHLGMKDQTAVITIDNHLLNLNRTEGLFLKLNRMIKSDENGDITPVESFSTAKSFIASDKLIKIVKRELWPSDSTETIGTRLQPDLFEYKRDIEFDTEGHNHIELNLIRSMPTIVTHPSPMLLAAQISTQVEFDRTFRTLVKEKSYRGKNVLYISGLNIDISPQAGQLFPLTKYVPWAALIKNKDGTHRTMEQRELMDTLLTQDANNPAKINLEDAINKMEKIKEIKIIM